MAKEAYFYGKRGDDARTMSLPRRRQNVREPATTAAHELSFMFSFISFFFPAGFTDVRVPATTAAHELTEAAREAAWVSTGLLSHKASLRAHKANFEFFVEYKACDCWASENVPHFSYVTSSYILCHIIIHPMSHHHREYKAFDCWASENVPRFCTRQIHTCMHAYIHAYMHTCIHTCMHTCIHTCMHAYLHTYIHTCMHTYIHTYIHTCTVECLCVSVCVYACLCVDTHRHAVEITQLCV